MGVRMIMADRKPELVLSGVNRGQNVAEDVTYSGTIAGAIEGAMRAKATTSRFVSAPATAHVRVRKHRPSD